jgi:hypothetical protein
MPKIYLLTDEESIISLPDEKTVFFSLSEFKNKIVFGDVCFICGQTPNEKPFNNEHIIPDWILRKFNLYGHRMNLPNGTSIKYGHYTVPCCTECNTGLGELFEEPISKLLSQPYHKISQLIEQDNSVYQLLYRWMSLIYLKVHLKDTSLAAERDERKKVTKSIGEEYDWDGMHHLHCMARAHFTGAKIQKEVYGSLLVLPTFPLSPNHSFHYIDSRAGHALLVQCDHIALIAVLNDSTAAISGFYPYVQKMNGYLTPFQIRDVFAHMVYISANLENRPVFSSTITDEGYEIQVHRSEEIRLYGKDEQVVSYGDLLYSYVQDIVPNDEHKVKILDEIREGKRQYLFDERGEFIRHDPPSR